MATKSKKKKVKKVAAKSKAPRSKSEAKPRESVANFIRDQLAKGVEPAKIVDKALEAFPGKKPTVGYVNWIREHAPSVSTTSSTESV